jgi:hypothetical protein
MKHTDKNMQEDQKNYNQHKCDEARLAPAAGQGNNCASAAFLTTLGGHLIHNNDDDNNTMITATYTR